MKHSVHTVFKVQPLKGIRLIDFADRWKQNSEECSHCQLWVVMLKTVFKVQPSKGILLIDFADRWKQDSEEFSRC